MFREWPYPQFQPSYDRLLIDDVGNLWTRHYSPAPADRTGWTVFAPDGEWLGEVEMPMGFEVLEIGDDRALGVWRDALDVEYLRVYAIEKPKDPAGGGVE
jgi:hypothetical protein